MDDELHHDDELRRIMNWASHGTLRQFQAEVGGKVAALGYEAELQGDTLTWYKVRREGGVLGIGKRKVREAVLAIARQGAEAHAVGAPDAEFVHQLAGMLKQH